MTAWYWVMPGYERPCMPTLPSLHGCAATHSMMWYESAVSSTEKAPLWTRKEAPVPLASATATV